MTTAHPIVERADGRYDIRDVQTGERINSRPLEDLIEAEAFAEAMGINVELES